MDIETKKQFDEHSKKLDDIYVSVEKTRKYFLGTLIISVVFFVLPLIGIAFILPMVLGTLTGGLI